jgi:hypothetical protein
MDRTVVFDIFAHLIVFVKPLDGHATVLEVLPQPRSCADRRAEGSRFFDMPAGVLL